MAEKNTPTTVDQESDTDRDRISKLPSLLSGSIHEHFQKIPPEYLDMTDNELENMFDIPRNDRMLRISFWREVDRCLEKQELRVNLTKVYEGVMTRPNFYHLIQNPARLAYMLRPPKGYVEQANDIIYQGTERLREALDAKLVYPNGHLDAKATKVVLDIVAYFENRVKGTMTQKVKLEAERKGGPTTVNIMNVEAGDLEKQLREVKEKLIQFEGQALLEGLPERVRDVNDDEEEADA